MHLCSGRSALFVRSRCCSKRQDTDETEDREKQNGRQTSCLCCSSRRDPSKGFLPQGKRRLYQHQSKQTELWERRKGEGRRESEGTGSSPQPDVGRESPAGRLACNNEDMNGHNRSTPPPSAARLPLPALPYYLSTAPVA